MKLTTAVGITVIAGAVFSGLAAVGSYAMGELDKKADNTRIDFLLREGKKAKIEMYTIQRDYYDIGDDKTKRDLHMIKSYNRLIDKITLEIQTELKQ